MICSRFLVSGELSSEKVALGLKSRTLPMSTLIISFTSSELQKMSCHLPLLRYFLIGSLFADSKMHQGDSGLDQLMPLLSLSSSIHHPEFSRNNSYVRVALKLSLLILL